MPDMRTINPTVIAEYRHSGGTLTGSLAGLPVLLLTTTGRRSGRPHTTPLGYIADGDRFVVAASAGGARTDPDWYRNLLAMPAVTVELGTVTWPGTAEPVAGAGRGRLFGILAARLPGMAEYATAAGRPIPIVTLTKEGR